MGAGSVSDVERTAEELKDFAATGTVPAGAQVIANEAFREARAEGCRCEPNVALSPLAVPPFWRALVEHDDWCPLVAKLRAAQQ